MRGVKYCPKRNFLHCRFCVRAEGMAIHRNSRPVLESIAALEGAGWVFTGRSHGKWSGICPDCNLFYTSRNLKPVT